MNKKTVRSELAVKLKQVSLATPLLTASGTSGTSDEINDLENSPQIIDALGAFVTKGVTLEARSGNREMRVVETRTGLLNSIGLQNSGAAVFVREELPRLANYNLPIIVNISAGQVDEFGRLSEFLMEHDHDEAIAGIEINVSCPNICAGGVAFGVDPRTVEKAVRAACQPLRRDVFSLTKMTPNVTDISEPAKGAIAGGTDGLSMINTLRGMAINVHTGSYYLGNKTGGLSGPAIKPVGIQMVHECYRTIPECRRGTVPIIGIGGIATWEDALEYIMAGATAVGIGTAWFVNPNVFVEIKTGLETYCRKHSTTITQKIGSVHEI